MKVLLGDTLVRLWPLKLVDDGFNVGVSVGWDFKGALQDSLSIFCIGHVAQELEQRFFVEGG